MILALLGQASVVPGKEWAVAAIIALTPVIVQIIDWLISQIEVDIPAWVKPTLSTALGSLLAWLGGVVTNDPLLIAAIGLATAGIRQVLVHFGRATARQLRRL